jgi:hypothetical protein
MKKAEKESKDLKPIVAPEVLIPIKVVEHKMEMGAMLMPPTDKTK